LAGGVLALDQFLNADKARQAKSANARASKILPTKTNVDL
jgi:hypothetical protein